MKRKLVIASAAVAAAAAAVVPAAGLANADDPDFGRCFGYGPYGIGTGLTGGGVGWGTRACVD